MTDGLVKRIRTVFEDTPEVASWLEQDGDSYDYDLAEARTHMLGMWETMQVAADRIEAQAAEIERLRELIKVTGDHWLALQHKHPIQWEGAIDGAMAAACAEIDWLRAVLELADAALRGANVNMNVLERKIAKALAGKAEQ